MLPSSRRVTRKSKQRRPATPTLPRKPWLAKLRLLALARSQKERPKPSNPLEPRRQQRAPSQREFASPLARVARLE